MEVLRAFRDGDLSACVAAASRMLEGHVITHEVAQALLISMQRLGADTGQIAGPLVAGLATRPWQQLLLRVTLGEVDGEVAVAAAATDDARCQARFYHGARLHTVGRIDDARRVLDDCLASSSACLERYALAEPERARLPRTDDESAAINLAEQAIALTGAASDLWKAGKGDQAAVLAERALELAKASGRKDQQVSILGTVGTLFHESGAPGRALALFQDQLRLARQVHGGDSPELAQASSNVALALSTLSHHAEAEPFLAGALGIYLAKFGPLHPMTAISLGNGALNLRRQGRYPDAARCYLRCLQITSQLYGEASPEHLRVLQYLAEMYESIDQRDAAGELRARIERLRGAPRDR